MRACVMRRCRTSTMSQRTRRLPIQFNAYDDNPNLEPGNSPLFLSLWRLQALLAELFCCSRGGSAGLVVSGRGAAGLSASPRLGATRGQPEANPAVESQAWYVNGCRFRPVDNKSDKKFHFTRKTWDSDPECTLRFTNILQPVHVAHQFARQTQCINVPS